MDDILRQCIKQRKVYFDRINIPPEYKFTWDDVIPIFDEQARTGNKRAVDTRKMFFPLSMNDHPLISSITEKLSELSERECNSCHVYAGLGTQTRASPVHKDRMHVFVVQVLGSCDWKVFEDGYDDIKKEGKATLSLRMIPGNCIYIPQGIYHAAFPDQSRMLLSFGFQD